MADSYLNLSCPKCKAHLARLYAGTRIVISFRCVNCKAISVLRIDEAKPAPHHETRQRRGEPSALVRIHPVRLAGN